MSQLPAGTVCCPPPHPCKEPDPCELGMRLFRMFARQGMPLPVVAAIGRALHDMSEHYVASIDGEY